MCPLVLCKQQIASVYNEAVRIWVAQGSGGEPVRLFCHTLATLAAHHPD